MLPKKKTKPQTKKPVITLYGVPKVGKSTFCSHIPDNLFIATEAGLNFLDTYQVPVSNWSQFIDICRELANTEHIFRTVTIDIIDNLYLFCAEHISKNNQVQHISDLSYGKGFSLTNNLFQRVLTKLSLMDIGLVFVSHAQTREITIKGKAPFQKTTLSLPSSARRIVLGMSDIILYADMDEDGNRVCYAAPTSAFEAGDRSGKLPGSFVFDYQEFDKLLKLKKNSKKKA